MPTANCQNAPHPTCHKPYTSDPLTRFPPQAHLHKPFVFN